MDRAISRDHTDVIFTTFNKSTNFTLVPMNSHYDEGHIFRQHFYNQNSLLSTTTSIRLDNIHNLDATIVDKQTGDKTTMRTLFTAQKDNNPFIDIHQFNSNRINFLVKKTNESWANDIINQFIYDYIPHHLTDESQAILTVPGKSPRIVGIDKRTIGKSCVD